MSSSPPGSSTPPIPDHELIRRIAVGSYGSIWLARNVLGSFRAVKIVQRRTFKSPRQYEREFEGVRQFEPISRSHPGFVHILHVGRSDAEGHFYYVMELADDLKHRQQIQPASYVPRTLRAELEQRRRLPLNECLLLGQTLLLALEELHERGLVHRDLKPANLIYVDGVPKLADIGTVATAGHKDTPVGSIGYNPPEGSGLPAGDVFSFGRVLYEMFSGVHVQELADALPDLRPRLKDERQHKFYAVIQAATHADPNRRPSSAGAFREALSALLPLNDADVPRADSVVPTASNPAPPELAGESHYGVVSPHSFIYVRREADLALEAALARQAGLLVISGAPQTGRTSLLARALHLARREGARVAFTDLQKFNAASFASLEKFYQSLGESLADQLDLPVVPRRAWDPRRTPNANLDRYLRREVLSDGFGRVVWGLDEMCRIQDWAFRSEFCGLVQAWSNEGALEPGGPLGRLTLILTAPTELRPDFGEHITLREFSMEELAELNRRCGSPLGSQEELEDFRALVNGQPFLCRYGLLELARRRQTLRTPLGRRDGWHEDLFAVPLQRIRSLLASDDALAAAMRRVLTGPAPLEANAFQRLRSAGLVTGESSIEARVPCELYASYLRRHL